MISETDVLAFLKKHPEFMDEYAKRLGWQKVSKIRSFDEVSRVAYEKKIDNMAQHMALLSENAVHNHDITQKLLQFDIALMGCTTIRQIHKALALFLKNQMGFSAFAFRLTFFPENKVRIPSSLLLHDDVKLRAYILTLNEPVCGTQLLDPAFEAHLPESPRSESFLHLPLRFHNETIGILLLGHPNPEYFTKDMATEYIALIGDALAATIARVARLHR